MKKKRRNNAIKSNGKHYKKTNFKWGITLGILAGITLIFSGVLTTMEITPRLEDGAGVAIGLWRVFAGSLVLFFSFYITTNRTGGLVVALIGIFEIFVLLFVRDFSAFSTAPLIAVLAGTIELLKK